MDLFKKETLSGQKILEAWQRIEKLPGFKKVFSKTLGLLVPYSGSLPFEVQTLAAGFAVVTLKDCRKVRNHLHSIHAMALANLGELATGLALNTAIAPGSTGIVVRFGVEYLKKARGKLTATAQCDKIPNEAERNFTVTAKIKDEQGDDVAIAEAVWSVRPSR